MDIQVLGPLQASVDGRLLPLGGTKPRALLAMLALDAGAPISTARLIDGLWGERSPATATKLVQVYVSQLRKALAAGGGGAEIVTRGRGYALQADDDAVDARRFERLIADGSPRAALALWRGPPLDDVADQPFAAPEIRRLEQLRLTAHELAIEQDMDAGRHRDVVGELERLVAVEPMREQLHAQRMLALYRSGRQAEALDAYREARAALVEAIGTEPGPELRRLHQAILVQHPALAAPPGEHSQPSLGEEPAASVPGALHGRERELNALLSGLERALAGRGGLFLVSGEAGIGKSRLLDELARHARERGAEVLWGRCWEAGGAPAYWPWMQSLRSHIRGHEPEQLRSELGAGAPAVAQMLPELRQQLPDLPEPPPLGSEAARFRLFENVASFLVAAAASRPIVLVLDDLHAADEPSLRLLQFVAGQLDGASSLVVGAYRDTDLEPDTTLASVMAELARERVAEVLPLAGLTLPEVGWMIESSAGLQAPPASVAAIHRRTEGNPLFVGEVVRMLSLEGRLEDVTDTASEVLPISPGVRELIGRRLRRLSEDCRGVLALAAVLGREFEFAALAHVSGRSEGELLEVLDEALQAHVVGEVPAAPGRLRFAHALIRDTLYADLGGVRRVRLHRDVAEALEAFYADDLEPYLAELAHHLLAAGETADPGKAVRFARAAGDQAAGLFAYEEAVRIYGMALGAVKPKGAAGDAARCELLLALADAQGRAGDEVGAKASFLHAAELATSAGLPELLARAAAGYGGRFLWARAAGDERLVPLLQDALGAVGEDDSILRVQLLSRFAAALRDEPSRKRRGPVAEQAVAAARRLGDSATLAYALDAGLAATEGTHDVEAILAQAGEVVALAEQIGDAERAFAGHEHAFWHAWTLGDAGRRAAELSAIVRLSDELRQPAQVWLVTSARTALALAEGRFTEAEELIEQAAAVGARAVGWNAAAARKIQRFVLLRERDELEGFEREVTDAEHEFPSPLVHRCVLAAVCARGGNEAEAAAIVNELAGYDLSDWHTDSEWLFSICLLAEACASLGAGQPAASLYEVLLPYGSLNAVAPAEAALGSAGRPLGLLAGALGRLDDAERHLDEALRMNERMAARPCVAHTALDYARVLVARDAAGDRARAGELAQRALQEYGSLAMQSFAAEAERVASAVATGQNKL